MKFTDGYWQMREGMTPYFPTQVYEVEVEPGAMTVFAPTTKIVTRGDTLEYFIIYGPTPREVLNRYTALTGRPALPPAWSFGLWLSSSFTTNYDEKTVTGFIRDMAACDIPLHVFHFDCFWMKEFNWCDFKWDAHCFPDPLARGAFIGLTLRQSYAVYQDLYPALKESFEKM